MIGEPRIFEWTFDQWAICFAAFPPPSLDVKGALESKRQWVEARPLYQPGHARILAADGHKRLEPKDLNAVRAIFTPEQLAALAPLSMSRAR